MLHRLCCCQSERLSSTCHSTRRNARETRLYLCCSLSSPEAAFSPGFYFTLESQLSSASSFSHLLNHTTSSLRSALQTCSLDVSSCSTLFHWKGVSYWNLSDFISVDSPSAGLLELWFHIISSLPGISTSLSFCDLPTLSIGVSCCLCHFRLSVKPAAHHHGQSLFSPPYFPAAAAAIDSVNFSWTMLLPPSSVPPQCAVITLESHPWCYNKTLHHSASTFISKAHSFAWLPPSPTLIPEGSAILSLPHFLPFHFPELPCSLEDLSCFPATVWDCMGLPEVHNQVQFGSPSSNSCDTTVPSKEVVLCPQKVEWQRIQAAHSSHGKFYLAEVLFCLLVLRYPLKQKRKV